MPLVKSELPVDVGDCGSEWARSMPTHSELELAVTIDGSPDRNWLPVKLLGGYGSEWPSFRLNEEPPLVDLINRVDDDLRDSGLVSPDAWLRHDISLRRGQGNILNHFDHIRVALGFSPKSLFSSVPHVDDLGDAIRVYSATSGPTTHFYKGFFALLGFDKEIGPFEGALASRLQAAVRHSYQFEANHLLRMSDRCVHQSPRIPALEYANRTFFRDYVSVDKTRQT